MPLILAAALSVVLLPLVDRLDARGLPRPVAVAACCLACLAAALGCAVILVLGVSGQLATIGDALGSSLARLGQAARGLGLDAGQVTAAGQAVAGALRALLSGLVSGLVSGVAAVAESVVGAVLALYFMFFLLKDARAMTSRAVRLLPAPTGLGRAAAARAAAVVRRYFLGMTLIALMNTALIVVGALILGLPALGTIALTTFLGAYVPYLGAFVSGALTVLIALGSGGWSDALWMLLVVVLANGMLQNLLAPFVFGAALKLHPMVVLLVTVLAGLIAGLAGVALAVPLTALAVDLARLRARSPSGGEVP
ncbi:AI-2E family transporter [Nonomuraea sp. NN258]|nr:AI-2E family transporter [Nonomuraea antri]